MTWGKMARERIAQVIFVYDGDDEAELRKLISMAYPFGERRMWPYKAWLREVKAAITEWKVRTSSRHDEPVTSGLFEEPGS